MSSRKIDKVATNVDDALEIVEELQDQIVEEHQDEPDAERLDELHETLEDAQDTIDGVEQKDE